MRAPGFRAPSLMWLNQPAAGPADYIGNDLPLRCSIIGAGSAALMDASVGQGIAHNPPRPDAGSHGLPQLWPERIGYSSNTLNIRLNPPVGPESVDPTQSFHVSMVPYGKCSATEPKRRVSQRPLGDANKPES